MENAIQMKKVLHKIFLMRQQKGYSYENMAADLDISPSAYRKIETGETRLLVGRLFQIAEALNVRIHEFFEDTNPTILHDTLVDSLQRSSEEARFDKNEAIMLDLLKTKDILIAQLLRRVELRG